MRLKLFAVAALSSARPASIAWAQAAEAGGSPPAEPVQEVTVHGVRPQPGRQEMTGDEVKQLPGSFGDAFRAIEAMPGVTPLVSGLPYFLVRGAPPGNTGFFIDGVPRSCPLPPRRGHRRRAPEPHRSRRLLPGRLPGALRSLHGRHPVRRARSPADRAHEEASIRLLDAGGLVSTPFADGRGDVVASGRYGYPGPLLSLFAPDVGLSYWDYQTRVRWRA